jgi:DNA-binding transcriptional regulator YdaS (Cro superfamily)
MKFDLVVEHFGSQVALARRLQVQQPAVSMWRKRGIPHIQQLRIQELTGGKFRAKPLFKPKRNLSRP